MQKVSKYKMATVYARAWLDAAKDKKAEDKVFDEVKQIKDACRIAPETWKLLAAPADDDEVKKRIIADLANKLKLSDISKEAMLLAAGNDRLNIIGLIADEFISLYYEDKGIIRVAVDTVVPLSEAQDKRLRSVLEKKLGGTVMTEYFIKPEVLGGLRVRFASQLIDDTLESKLNKIESLIKQGKA